MDFNKRIGETRGIFKLVKVKDEKTGIFYCSVCKNEHEGHLLSWHNRGRKRCGMKKTNHILYDRYAKIIDRCYNSSSQRYKYYGGRGIKVCKRWLDSFDNFLEDMEGTFKPGLEIDRIDNNKGYSPENCRWVTHSENMLNRNGFKNTTGFPGVRKQCNKYHGRFQKNKKNYQTKPFNTPEEAYEELQKLKQSL
ncbi:hypothetical protein [Staphylococcus haemolyticus]|uniref:hypothetical protein n=1 Tax=Staphylococcus haemolyticus TaxID=1283 RepID=UPI0028FF1EBB|nr:hypothetical protein [Staphylococcus haemolyticus]MDU0485545.1 hypothetical protein [Staphylococcus haemolyticus]